MVKIESNFPREEAIVKMQSFAQDIVNESFFYLLIQLSQCVIN